MKLIIATISLEKLVEMANKIAEVAMLPIAAVQQPQLAKKDAATQSRSKQASKGDFITHAGEAVHHNVLLQSIHVHPRPS